METYPKLIPLRESKYKDALFQEAGLLRYAKISEIWDIPYSSQKLSYLTHSIFRFFGKFPPPIAKHLIDLYTKKGELILDPMCGSGTSAIEALLNKRKIICADISPLSKLLVNIKCQYVSEKKLLKCLVDINNKYRDKSFNHIRIKRIPLDKSKIDHWFLPSTYKNLVKLLNIIIDINDEKLSMVFRGIFISIIRKVSKATSLQGRLFLDVCSAQENPIFEFNKAAEKIIKSIASLPYDFKPPAFIQEDMRKLSLKGQKPKLVICHPPYFNVYKFSSIFALELPWLMCDKKIVQAQEIREFFKVGRIENVHKYVLDMKDSIINIAIQLKKNSIFALMIGDTRIRSEYIPTTKLLLDSILPKCDIKLIKVAVRKPQFTEASWVASQRRTGKKVGTMISDFILVFRKK